MTPGWAYAGNDTLPWLKEHAIQVAFAEFPGHLNTFPVYAFRLDAPVVIGLTASILQGERERYLAAGMDSVLAKPINVDEVCSQMASLNKKGLRGFVWVDSD